MKPTPDGKSNENEDKVYGLHAAMMLFRVRPKAIKKAYVDIEHKNKFSSLLSYCAKQKIAYKMVEKKALESVSGSIHNEGICLYTTPKKVITQSQFLSSLSANKSSTMVLLDGVSNPHNIGALVRSMAHFGVDTLLIEESNFPALSGANFRIAEGGYEHINIVKVENIDKISHQLKKHGYKLIGTSSHTENNLYEYTLPEKLVFILGNEVKGMSKKAISLCDDMLIIPGTGNVESLNVAQSTSLLLGERYRQHKA